MKQSGQSTPELWDELWLAFTCSFLFVCCLIYFILSHFTLRFGSFRLTKCDETGGNICWEVYLYTLFRTRLILQLGGKT